MANSHTLTLPSQAPAATNASSLDHAMLQMAARVRFVSVAMGAPDNALHKRTQASDDAAATRDELGLKCTLVMGDERPARTATARWACVSHRRSDASSETDAKYFPLESNATEITPLVSSVSTATCCCAATSHSRTLLSSEPDAKYFPLESNATE